MKQLYIKIAVAAIVISIMGFNISFSANAKTITEESLFYSITEEGEAIVTSGGVKSIGMENVVLPAIVQGYPVVGIGQEAFKGRTDFKKVILPREIRYMADSAFEGCTNLEEVILQEGIQYIGKRAFMGCTELKEISIPDSAAYVGENAFSECTKLLDIEYPQSAYIDAYAFEDTAWQERRDEGKFRIRGSRLIDARENEEAVIEIPYGITEIAGCSVSANFYGLAVIEQDVVYEEIILPQTMIKLGENSFNHTQINMLRIPQGVKEISKGTFMGSRIGWIGLPQGLEIIRQFAFGNTILTEIELPNTLKAMEQFAFESSGLQRIRIPSSVRYIGRNAFMHCANLSEVIFEEGLVSVYADAFDYCDKLERLQYPESLEYIESSERGTFSGALKRIYIPKKTADVDESFLVYFQKYNSPIIVYGQKESCAEKVARAAGMKFVEIEKGDDMP